MKHVRKVSSERRVKLLVQADAKDDFIDTLYRGTVDFIYSKMTQTSTGSGA